MKTLVSAFCLIGLFILAMWWYVQATSVDNVSAGLSGNASDQPSSAHARNPETTPTNEKTVGGTPKADAKDSARLQIGANIDAATTARYEQDLLKAGFVKGTYDRYLARALTLDDVKKVISFDPAIGEIRIPEALPAGENTLRLDMPLLVAHFTILPDCPNEPSTTYVSIRAKVIDPKAPRDWSK